MKRRIGKFYITRDVFEEPEWAVSSKVFERVAIVRCELLFNRDEFEYIALSQDFDEIDPAIEPPEYACIIHKEVAEDETYSYSAHFEKVKPYESKPTNQAIEEINESFKSES